ncbi:hypothetical protein MHK_006465 [Candidatus Magnetomorum sp. HK-1]|nr:hypothetical protein MHK_006465 [Candidatus Magnetomorum sp. HK-1]
MHYDLSKSSILSCVYLKGRFAEYMVSNHLKYRACEDNEMFCSMMNNLPDDFEFVHYQSVWKYTASPVLKNSFEIDVFAEALADLHEHLKQVYFSYTIQ